MSILGLRRVFLVVVTIGALATVGVGSSGRIRAADLAWKFEKGKVRRYELSQKNAMKVETQGQDLESTSTLTIDLTWTVAEVLENGSAKITQTVDRVRVDLEAGTQHVAYDSKTDDPEKAGDGNDSAETLRKFYTIATAEPYTLTMNRQGEIVDAVVPPKLVDLIKEYQFQPLADTGSVLSTEGLKKMFVQFFPKLPEQAVEPGSTWNGALEVPAGPLLLTLQTKYTLESADAQAAKISGAINTMIKPRPGVPTTLEVKSQTSSAEYGFDIEDGCLDQTAVTQTLSVEAKAGERATQMMLSLSVNAKRVKEGE